MNTFLLTSCSRGSVTIDPDGITLTKDIRLGILFLITHFYENRSAVSEVEMVELPLTYTWLVGPHRFYPR